MLKNLEGGLLEYKITGKFLANIRKEFREGNEETVKVVELKRAEQRRKIIKEFVQEFRKVARGSKYERRHLVEKFKREMNRIIHKKLMELEQQPTLIK